ncbi:MAG: hypothetical protein HYY35_04430 [Deltaproteobacteria bacterium]|nr:hypothetical protein [Deltaproteobacteria bacterium]
MPIPYQFDQRNDLGDIIFSDAAEGSDFAFDRNDELVFMAKDAGDRVTAATLPAGSADALEIELADPVDGGRGWAYLVRFSDDPPPPSAVRYATFDTALNHLGADLYSIDYAPGRNYFLAMRLAPEAGGNGESIADRMSVRVNPTFSLLFTSWSPEFTEDSFTVQIDGVKNGSVRAIRRVRQSLDLGKYFPEVPGGTTYTYYYFSSFSTPSKFSLPWLALKALRAFRFTGVSVLGKHASGMQYWDAANPDGVRLGTTLAAGVETAQDHDWYVLSGSRGACLHTFAMPEEWRRWGIVRGTVLQGDSPTAVADVAGYSLLNMTNLRAAGVYDMDMAVIFLPHAYRPGDEVEPLKMLRQPLAVLVRPVAM